MPSPEHPSQHPPKHSAEQAPESPWRRPLLITEFSALALLIGSMVLLSRMGSESQPISPAWLMIPATASLIVFLSFLGLMYQRWFAAAGNAARSRRHQWLFGILAVVLVSFWGYAVLETWRSLAA